MSLQMQQAMRRANGGFGLNVPVTWGNWEPPSILGSQSQTLEYPDEGNSGAPPWWITATPLFGIIGKTVSNIFSPAATGVASNAGGLLQQQQQQYQELPPGYSYNSSGQIIKDSFGSITDFVSNNPILVAVAVGGIVLLFMRPPGRR